MKKLLITALLVFGIAVTASAQGKGKTEFGFNIGYNMSTVSISDSEGNADTSGGVNLAVSADYYFSDRWSIKGKLIYDQKGWDNGFIQDLDTGTYYNTDFNLNYVTIPVMANWHFGRKRNWYLNFGPYVGFLLNAKDTTFDMDVKDSFNNTDIGLSLGIGVKIPVTNKMKVFIEYEGQGGFSDIFKHNDGSAVQNSRSAFNVGINFLMN